MLQIFAYFAITILIILIIAYFYIEAQKRKAIEEKKKAIILRVSSMKANFMADMKRLVEDKILTIIEHKSIYKIANNFFVFQPITPKSITYCEQLLRSVSNAMPTDKAESLNFVLAQEQVSLFIRSLPVATSGYNAVFYRNELPELIKQLVSAQEYMYDITNENENINEAVLDSVPATAA